MARSKRADARSDVGKTSKIGAAAHTLNTTTRTLRFYEELGILAPRRTSAKTRSYTKEDIERVQAVQCLTDLGIGLRGVIALATVRSQSKTGDTASHKVHRLLDDMRRDVEIKKNRCEDLLSQIDAAVHLVKQCFGCQVSPRHGGCDACPVARNVQNIRLLRLIWDQDKP
ncbi:MAG: MerR family transcriptional regulator [Acidiferrobacter sp.]